MNKYPTLFIIHISLFLIFHINCADNPDKILKKSIKSYQEGISGSFEKIESALLKKITLNSFNSTNLKVDSAALYFINENQINIFHPVNKSFSLADGEQIKHFTLNNNYCAITDEKLLSIYRTNGSHEKEIILGDKKRKIKAILSYEDMIIYYVENKLFSYDFTSDTTQQLTNDTFKPPYTKYYSVKFYPKENILGIQAGIAGSYYFSIIDLPTRKILIKNISISSSKLYMSSSHIYYIFGSTGNWELKKISLKSKNKSKINKFNDLIDIELTSHGLIYENSKGLWVSSYEMKSNLIPFKYRLFGKYKDLVVLKYKNKIYLTDLKKLIDDVNFLKNNVPEIFSTK